MKNILNIEVNAICNCSCFENIGTDTNEIIVRYKRENPINPKIKVIVGSTSTEYSLEFTDGIAIFNIDLNLFLEYVDIKFQFLDDGYEGIIFQLRCADYSPNTWYKTLQLFRVTDSYYVARMVSTIDLSDAGIGDGLEIDDDGNLTVTTTPNVTQITAESTGETITKVTIAYDDETSNTYSCTYDDNGRLTKFGNIPITYNGV